ncbi:hypothetical protein BJX96DRAFT_163901 [Aspergillus floccosus]
MISPSIKVYLFYRSFIFMISTISMTHPAPAMEDYSHHWNETLLGKDFWEDAEEYNQPINDCIEAGTDNTAAKPHRRRFSMSDVFGLNAFSALRGRSVDSSRPVRSRSRSSRTPKRPLMSFRGSVSWFYIPRNRQELGLDVFWPTTEQSSRDTDTLPIEELAPLCEFRNLRVLKLTGMVQSYQKYIWQAAWLNPRLEELELEMAVPPRIRRGFNGKWPYIKGGWMLSEGHYGGPVYYGQYGDGNLSHKIGVGEYLDKLAIEKAKVRAMALRGRTRNRLSIRTLTLTGFVVDADAFLRWFDPRRLRCIHFKNDCVDAGFYLSLPMKKVSILFPREIEENLVIGRRVDLVSELKVVRLLNGNKVEEIPYRQGLARGFTRGRNLFL